MKYIYNLEFNENSKPAWHMYVSCVRSQTDL